MTDAQGAWIFVSHSTRDWDKVRHIRNSLEKRGHKPLLFFLKCLRDEPELDERLINRFDYDGDYGTVLNRFLMQAAINYPLTVHGTGGQTRAFIHIRDTVRCVELAILNPPKHGDRVSILNQMTETHRVRDLAEMIAEMTGAEIQYLPNPRNEHDENDLHVENECFIGLGLKPTTLESGLLEEVAKIADKYKDKCDMKRIRCVSYWNNDRQTASEQGGGVQQASKAAAS